MYKKLIVSLLLIGSTLQSAEVTQAAEAAEATSTQTSQQNQLIASLQNKAAVLATLAAFITTEDLNLFLGMDPEDQALALKELKDRVVQEVVNTKRQQGYADTFLQAMQSCLGERNFKHLLLLHDFGLRVQDYKNAEYWFNVSPEGILNLSDQGFSSLGDCGAISDEPVTGFIAHRNLFKELGPLVFDRANLTELQEIEMAYNQIHSIHQDALRGLHYLAKLNLAYNQLDNLPEGIFDDQQETLQELDLSYNKFQTLRPERFLMLQALRNLNIAENPLYKTDTDAIVSAMKRCNPGCDVTIQKTK